MSDLAKQIESFLQSNGGCRPLALLRHFDGVEASVVWEALDSLENVEEMDVGDEDCPKPYIYLV